jgi:YesN/AraC family two-component response regulator
MIKIMLIDDSPVIISLIEKIIGADVIFDTQILSFLDAKLAKEQFLKINPDFVITDIEMPIFDGFQLIEYIRSVGNTPILAMSSSTFKNNNTDTLLYCAKSLGSDYTILKNEIPENISQLTTNIITTHCI